MASRTPPHDADAERAVIGAAMLSEASSPNLAEALALLTPESFYVPRHSSVWAAMQVLRLSGDPVDEVSVAQQLRADGGKVELSWLAEVSSTTPTAANLQHYARVIRDLEIRRRTIAACSSVIERGYGSDHTTDELVDSAVASLAALGNERVTRPIPSAKELMRDELKALEQRMHNGGVVGHQTGWVDLDRTMGTLAPGNLVFIGARPSMGKTAFMLGLLRHLSVDRGIPAFVASLEMTNAEITQRILSQQSRVDLERLCTGKPQPSDWAKLAHAASLVAHSPFWVDDTGSSTVSHIRSKAIRLHARKPLGLVLVDYLQLLTVGESRTLDEAIGVQTKALKGLAKELGCPVVVLSQLNRSLESRQDKRPMLSDLRNSGNIEQDADKVLFLYRDEYYNKNSQDKGIAEVIVAKNRNGATGTVCLRWDAKCARFDNLSA